MGGSYRSPSTESIEGGVVQRGVWISEEEVLAEPRRGIDFTRYRFDRLGKLVELVLPGFTWFYLADGFGKSAEWGHPAYNEGDRTR